MSFPKSPNQNWIIDETILSIKSRDSQRLSELKDSRKDKKFKLVKVSDHPATFKEIEII